MGTSESAQQPHYDAQMIENKMKSAGAGDTWVELDDLVKEHKSDNSYLNQLSANLQQSGVLGALTIEFAHADFNNISSNQELMGAQGSAMYASAQQVVSLQSLEQTEGKLGNPVFGQLSTDLQREMEVSNNFQNLEYNGLTSGDINNLRSGAYANGKSEDGDKYQVLQLMQSIFGPAAKTGNSENVQKVFNLLDGAGEGGQLDGKIGQSDVLALAQQLQSKSDPAYSTLVSMGYTAPEIQSVIKALADFQPNNDAHDPTPREGSGSLYSLWGSGDPAIWSMTQDNGLMTEEAMRKSLGFESFDQMANSGSASAAPTQGESPSLTANDASSGLPQPDVIAKDGKLINPHDLSFDLYCAIKNGLWQGIAQYDGLKSNPDDATITDEGLTAVLNKIKSGTSDLSLSQSEIALVEALKDNWKVVCDQLGNHGAKSNATDGGLTLSTIASGTGETKAAMQTTDSNFLVKMIMSANYDNQQVVMNALKRVDSGKYGEIESAISKMSLADSSNYLISHVSQSDLDAIPSAMNQSGLYFPSSMHKFS